MARVLLGMSGGVDSTAAAKLLIDNGYDVSGVTLKLHNGGNMQAKDIEDAKKAAARLGIEHFVFGMEELFCQRVMTPFADSYLNGETPNPCIECNKHIKFGEMLRRAEELGFDYVATGHYAVREYDSLLGKHMLKRPADRSKDQTYVLYSLTQKQLSRIIFPLGGYTKDQIRAIAGETALLDPNKPDSQDICFVPDGDYASFIERHTGISPEEGDFLDMSGKLLGRHKGVIHYTVGQRKGLGIALGAPAYVVEKNALKNTVTLGSNGDLMKDEITVKNVNLIYLDKIEDGMRVTVKTRYSQSEKSALLYSSGDAVTVKFDSPQRAPAPGQAAVFYDGDTVIGGGTIK